MNRMTDISIEEVMKQCHGQRKSIGIYQSIHLLRDSAFQNAMGRNSLRTQSRPISLMLTYVLLRKRVKRAYFSLVLSNEYLLSSLQPQKFCKHFEPSREYNKEKIKVQRINFQYNILLQCSSIHNSILDILWVHVVRFSKILTPLPPSWSNMVIWPTPSRNHVANPGLPLPQPCVKISKLFVHFFISCRNNYIHVHKFAIQKLELRNHTIFF